MTALREGLPPLPARMAKLKIDERGYPVPWFVAWIDGKPDFRVADSAKLASAVRDQRCWVCGEKTGRYLTFVIGPMCAVNRVSSEPPAHLECATFSAQACPFLCLPKAQRREANLPEGHKAPAGTMITRNPGVTLLWTTRSYQRFRAPSGHLFHIGNPTSVQWFAQGRPATRDEVMDSIDSGMPLLAAEAMKDGPRALAVLAECFNAACELLPAEPLPAA